MIELTVEAIGIRAPPSIPPDLPVTEAAQHLRRPAVPALVVRTDDTVVGIVTESDIVALVAETAEQPAVRAIMSTPVTTIAPTATLQEAAATMRTAGVRHLPVVDAGRYYGLLSAQTLAPYLSRQSLEIEWPGEPVRVIPAENGELTLRG